MPDAGVERSTYLVDTAYQQPLIRPINAARTTTISQVFLLLCACIIDALMVVGDRSPRGDHVKVHEPMIHHSRRMKITADPLSPRVRNGSLWQGTPFASRKASAEQCLLLPAPRYYLTAEQERMTSTVSILLPRRCDLITAQ